MRDKARLAMDRMLFIMDNDLYLTKSEVAEYLDVVRVWAESRICNADVVELYPYVRGKSFGEQIGGCCE